MRHRSRLIFPSFPTFFLCCRGFVGAQMAHDKGPPKRACIEGMALQLRLRTQCLRAQTTSRLARHRIARDRPAALHTTLPRQGPRRRLRALMRPIPILRASAEGRAVSNSHPCSFDFVFRVSAFDSRLPATGRPPEMIPGANPEDRAFVMSWVLVVEPIDLENERNGTNSLILIGYFAGCTTWR